MIKIKSFQAIPGEAGDYIYALDVSGQLWRYSPTVDDWEPIEGPRPVRREKKTVFERLLELQDDMREEGLDFGEVASEAALQRALGDDSHDGPVVDTDMPVAPKNQEIKE